MNRQIIVKKIFGFLCLFFLFLFLLWFLAGCVRPIPSEDTLRTATAVSVTSEPIIVQRTIVSDIETPEPTPEVVASINLVDRQLEDGSIQTVAELSIAPLRIGTFNVTVLKNMLVSEPSIVTLAIDPDTGLTELTKTPMDSDSPLDGDPDNLLKVTDELEIYPVMTAELVASSEDVIIEDMDQATKPIISRQIATWNWLVTPKHPGNIRLFLQISIPVKYENQILENAQMVATRELWIRISQLPTATPTITLTPLPTNTSTPTPSISERIVIDIQENAFFIIFTLFILVITIIALFWIAKKARTSQPLSFNTSSIEGHSSKQLTKLLTLVDDRFNEEELQTLCFNLGIQYDNLPAKGKVYKVRELIEYCTQQGRVNELIGEAEKMRPGPEWSEVRVS